MKLIIWHLNHVALMLHWMCHLYLYEHLAHHTHIHSYTLRCSHRTWQSLTYFPFSLVMQCSKRVKCGPHNSYHTQSSHSEHTPTATETRAAHEVDWFQPADGQGSASIKRIPLWQEPLTLHPSLEGLLLVLLCCLYTLSHTDLTTCINQL